MFLRCTCGFSLLLLATGYGLYMRVKRVEIPIVQRNDEVVSPRQFEQRDV